MKNRFIIKRPSKKILDTNKPSVKAAIKKILIQEQKVITKVQKKAKEREVNISGIHYELMLYAMRHHVRNVIRDLLKNSD